MTHVRSMTVATCLAGLVMVASPPGELERYFRETGVNADAARVGAQIAAVVADVARRNNWVPLKH